MTLAGRPHMERKLLKSSETAEERNMAKCAVKSLIFASVTVGLMTCSGSISYAGSGAIVYSPSDGAAGMSSGHQYLIDAVSAARNQCRQGGGTGCSLVATEQNQCVYLATGAGGGWGTGNDPDVAIAVCSKRTTGCQAMHYICN